MTVSKCPRCHDAIRIPTGEISEDAEAECPRCGESYSFAAVLQQLPPLLRIKGAGFDHAAVSEDPAGVGVETDHDQFRYDFEEPSETSELAPMNVAPVVTAPRRRKSRGGLRGGIGMVLGGLMALPVAGGILLLLGKAPDLGFWPFDGQSQTQSDPYRPPRADFPVGSPPTPSVAAPGTPATDARALAFDSIPDPVIDNPLPHDSSRVADEDQPGFELPPKIRGSDSMDEPAPAEADGNLSTRILESPSTREPLAMQAVEAQGADESLALPSGSSSEQSRRDSAVIVVPIESIGEDREDLFETRVDQPDGLPDPLSVPTDVSPRTSDSEEDRVIEMPVPESADSSLAAPEVISDVDDVADQFDLLSPVPTVEHSVEEATELVAAAKKASRMVDAVATYVGSGKERDRRLMKTYMQIAVACELAENNSDSIRAMAQKVKRSSVQRELSNLASEWLIYSDRDSDGIMVIGQLSGGSGPTIKLDTGEVLKVTGSVDVLPSQRAIVLGKMIGDESIEPVLIESLP